MKKFMAIAAIAGLGAILTGGAARAQTFPGGVVGQWSIRANDTQTFPLTIQTQSADAPCAQITGTMGTPNDPIAGYYCAATGQISFLRNSASSGASYQVFTGQLSWTGTGGTRTQMTGNFSNYSGGNNTGAFSFAAVLLPSR